MNINFHFFIRRPFVFASLLWLCSAAVLADSSQDFLLGNGTPGPYSLSWKQILSGTETVQVNQQAQTRGLDYTVDPVAGTITFTKPLPAQSGATVHYDYDPTQAVRTGAVMKVPLSFDLARLGNGRVSFNALYQKQGAGLDTAPGTLTLGLGSGWQGSKANLTTRVLFAPALGGSGTGTSAGSGLGVSLNGGASAARGVQMTFGFSRAGQGMAADSGLTAGMQIMTVGTQLTASRQMQATMDYTKSDPLTSGALGETTREAASLSFAPAQTVHLQTHWVQTTLGDAAPTQNADISVSATPTAKTNLNASFSTQDAAGTAQDTQALNLAASLAPAQNVAVTATVGQTRDAAGPVNRQQVTLAMTPRATLSLNTGLALRQNDTSQTTEASVGGQIQPVSFLQFSATYKNRTASNLDPCATDTLDTGMAKLTLSPLRSLRLIGSYAQNPDDVCATPQHLARRGLGLETSLGALSLSGGYDWQRQYDTPSVGTTLNVGVGLRVSSETQINGSYKQTLSGLGDASTGASFYAFALSHNLGDRFHLSLGGTMQKPLGPVNAADPDYTANASLGMKF